MLKLGEWPGYHFCCFLNHLLFLVAMFFETSFKRLYKGCYKNSSRDFSQQTSPRSWCMLESEAMLLAIFNFLKRAIFNWVLQRLVLTCPLQNLQMPLNVQWFSSSCLHMSLEVAGNLLVENDVISFCTRRTSLFNSSKISLVSEYSLFDIYFKRCFPMAELRLLNGSLANVTVLRFAAMVPAGAIADAVGSTVRVPFVACRPDGMMAPNALQRRLQRRNVSFFQ